MRIGIITLPLNINYGGVLQAYALQQALIRLGHRPILLEPQRGNAVLPFRKMWKLYLHRIWQKYGTKDWSGPIFAEYHLQAVSVDYLEQFIRPFIRRYISLQEVGNFAKLSEDHFGALIVGSDQVWRQAYNRNLDNAFLEFAKDWNIKRISYAASFGLVRLEYSEQALSQYRGLLQKFDGVSVREQSAIDLCKIYLGREDATQVLDPTMLLETKDYNRLIDSAHTHPISSPLMCYILDKSEAKSEILSSIEEQMGCKGFQTQVDLKGNLWQRVQPAIEQWLRGFRDSKLIVTDSFHACVFAILYQKPFIVLANDARGNTRIISLLSIFGLGTRLVQNERIDINEFLDVSDFQNAHVTLSFLREQSFSFLTKHLGINDKDS